MRKGNEEKINIGKFDALRCFAGCQTMLTDEDLDFLFQDSPDYVARQRRLLRQRAEEGDILLRYCTRPGCNGKMRADNLKARKLTCPEC